jgi:hypothetical protein
VRVMDGIGFKGCVDFREDARRVGLGDRGVASMAGGALEDRLVGGILAEPPAGLRESMVEVIWD